MFTKADCMGGWVLPGYFKKRKHCIFFKKTKIKKKFFLKFFSKIYSPPPSEFKCTCGYWKKIRHFLLLNLLKKISKSFHSQFHWKKNSTFFWKIRKKNFCHKNKKGVTRGGEIPTIFPGKSDMTFRWVLTLFPPPSLFKLLRAWQICQWTSRIND